MNLPRRAGALLLAFLGCPLTLAARQAPVAYHWTAGDTLRYAERTDGRVDMQMPNGRVLVQTEHEARIAVTSAGDDALTAWYEALRLAQTGPGAASQRPSTDRVLGLPFELRLTEQGHPRTRAVPPIPDDIAGMTDLTRQFDDFFISLPGTDLGIGARWVDTVLADRPGRPTDTYAGRHVRHYEVMRDTIIKGAGAVVIAVRQDVRMDASSFVPEQQLTVTIGLVGEDSGEAIFVPVHGRLHARTRKGRLSGTLTMSSAAGELSVPQAYEYSSAISVVE